MKRKGSIFSSLENEHSEAGFLSRMEWEISEIIATTCLFGDFDYRIAFSHLIGQLLAGEKELLPAMKLAVFYTDGERRKKNENK